MVLFIAKFLPLLALLAVASPYPSRDGSLRLRDDGDSDDSTEPQFPSSPASCGLCQDNYDNIKLCMSLVPVMEDTDPILSDPNSYVSVITCACTDPFHSTFPQCVDCFDNTGQEAVLNITSVDDVITGINKVCAFEHALFGGGATSSIPLVDEGDATSTTSSPVSTSASTSPTSTPIPTSSAPISKSATTSTAAPATTSSSAAAPHYGASSGLLIGAVLLVLGTAW